MPNTPIKPDFSNVLGGAAKEKADFSNVQSGVSTTAPPKAKADFSNVQSGVTSTAPTINVATVVTYTVVKGDNLSKIAKHHYGSANKWKLIFEANRDQIDDPDLIRPGQVLKIPAADKGPAKR